MTIKRYSLVNRNTGTIRTTRATREAARTYKRNNGFKFAIFDNSAMKFVR